MRLILLLCLAGCGSTPLRTDTDPPPIPTLIKDQGKTWIGGLKDHHGWDRHAWVVLSRANTKLAVALVIDGEGQDAVLIHVLAALPNTDVEGAQAEVMKDGHWPRVGKLLGRIVERETDLRIRIDLGRADGVVVGDRFTVRPNPRDRTELGALLEVTVLHETHAEAEIRVPAGPPGPDQPIVFLPAGEQGPRPTPKLHIVVAGFTPQADNEKTTAFAQKYARDFAARLTDATKGWQGVQVSHVPDIIPHDDHTGHDKARELGRKHQAQLVVWGTMMCLADEGCASPRFTVVDPQALQHAEISAGDHTFTPSPLTENKVSEDLIEKPEILAAALLGFMAEDVGDLQHAVYYLGRAAPGLTGSDRLQAMERQAASEFLSSDMVAADATAALLEASGDRFWANAGRRWHALIEARQGHPDRALSLLNEVLATDTALSHRNARAVTLGYIARIRRDKGEIDAALTLHEENKLEFESLGDRSSRAAALGDIARIRADKGDIDAALALHEERLKEYEALGDRRSRASALGDIARIRTSKGDIDAALALHEEGLKEFEALGDRRERAITLGDIAHIRRSKGDIDAAQALHEEQKKEFETLGDRRSLAVILGDFAHIRLSKGDLDGALALHEERKKEFEALGDRRERATTLGDLAHIRLMKGEVGAALLLGEEQLKEFEALGDRRSRALALGDIAHIRLMKGEIEAALVLHKLELKEFEALGDRHSRATTLGDIARIRLMNGDPKTAAKGQRERLVEFEALGDAEGIVAALADLAQALVAGGQVEEARAHLARAWPLARRLGNPAWVGGVGYLHGVQLLESAASAEAVPVLEAAVAGFRQMGMAQELQMAEQALAEARAAAGQ